MDIDQFSKEWDRETEMSDAKCLFKLQVMEVDGKDEFGVLNSLPPFITTTYKMVDDPSLDSIISWSQKNNSFIIWDMSELERYLLHEKLMTKSVFFFRLDIYVSYLYVSIVSCYSIPLDHFFLIFFCFVGF